jgi:hypothetical protein
MCSLIRSLVCGHNLQYLSSWNTLQESVICLWAHSQIYQALILLVAAVQGYYGLKIDGFAYEHHIN